MKSTIVLVFGSVFLINQSVSSIITHLENFAGVNPNASLTAPELIEQSGYSVEIHHVTTEDGYILEMHRIPRGIEGCANSNKPPVLIMHALLSSSVDWIITGPNRALGYLLADEGYDVWLGNARGNTYSKRHVHLSPRDPKFWEFSWHEIGMYDLPCMIDNILNKTGYSKLIYVGFSQGTTSFFVMGSERSEYNQKIEAMFGLGPAAYLKNMRSTVVKSMAYFERPATFLTSIFGNRQFWPSTELLKLISAEFCSEWSITQPLCAQVMFSFVGYDKEQLDKKLLPVMIAHTPAGCSTKQVLHYLQLHRNGGFTNFNYGPRKNKRVYGSTKPPSYNLSKVVAPVFLYYGLNDYLADPKDVLQLSADLPNVIDLQPVPFDKFNHLDFIWALEEKSLVYDQVIRTMNNLTD